VNNERLTELARQVGAACLAQGCKLAVAESCTGGGLAEAITRIAGSSQWFDRGFVTYSNEAKRELLKVRGETLETCGAVSEDTAREMALGTLASSQAEIAVSITGIAGPDGATPGKPVGMVCFAWARRDGRVVAETQHFSGNRAMVRHQAIEHALHGILLILR
jgi:nicotinamide-nucleotide amidase